MVAGASLALVQAKQKIGNCEWELLHRKRNAESHSALRNLGALESGCQIGWWNPRLIIVEHVVRHCQASDDVGAPFSFPRRCEGRKDG
jgi:hypothetical protein